MKYWGWYIFLIFILLRRMALYSGVIDLKIIQYSRFKQEQLGLLWIQAVEHLVMNYLKNYRFWPSFWVYLSVLMFVVKNRHFFLNQILMFVILVQDIMLIYTCPQLKMGPGKKEGSYWGYKEQGTEQLQNIQSFQRTANNTTALR
jgi:hypothetical protein